MDPQLIDDAYWVIAASIVGFLILAFLLLYPVFRFINREAEDSRSWTPDEIARRQREGGDGHPGAPPEPVRDDASRDDSMPS